MDEQNHTETGNTSHPLGTKLFLGKIKSKINLKKILIMIAIVTIAGLSIAAYKVNEIRTRAFMVSFGNKNVGLLGIKNKH